jgi:plastocyanin
LTKSPSFAKSVILPSWRNTGAVPIMTERKTIGTEPNRGRRITLRLLAALLFAAMSVLGPRVTSAAQTVTLSLTIKDHKFEPAELHAPAGKNIAIQVKNLNSTVAELESGELHFEKVIAAGHDATVYVRPLRPGRYKFFDDFHRATQGFLVVP